MLTWSIGRTVTSFHYAAHVATETATTTRSARAWDSSRSSSRSLTCCVRSGTTARTDTAQEKTRATPPSATETEKVEAAEAANLNLLLSDEINRAPPKTQAALLEAMQERQVTIEGDTHRLELPFLVIATQNPIEYEGTYPLPEAQLDRFILRTAFGYPSREGEVDVLARRIERESDDVDLRAIVDRETLLAMQAAVETVHVAQSVQEYCVDLVAATRASHSHRGRGQPARQPRSSQALALSRGAPGPRFRASRRREGRGRPGARAPPRPPAGALGATRVRGGRRPRGARRRADAEGGGRGRRSARVTRTGSPRIVGYAALAALGLIGGLALRRPELAVVAAPFALILAIGLRSAREPGRLGRSHALRRSQRRR